MSEEDLHERARRLVRAADLPDGPFVRQRYEATDLIISTKPVVGGMFASQPYRGEPFDAAQARVVKAGWDHAHCHLCRLRIMTGDDWWAAPSVGHVGLCPACHDLLIGWRQDPRWGALERLGARDRRGTPWSEGALTEAGWRTSTIPRAMLISLEDRANAREIDRKLRLFACACARRVLHLLEDERCVKAVEVAERYADGRASAEELDAAGFEAACAGSDLYVSGGLAAADEARMRDPEANRRPAGVVFGEALAERVWTAARAADQVAARKVGKPGTADWYEGGAWVAALGASRSASDAIASDAELRAREAPYDAAVAALSAPLSASDAFAGAAELQAREAAEWEALEARRYYEEPWQADLLRCLFGNPFRPVGFDPTWTTPGSSALARAIDERRSFDLLPDLAVALEAAGCRDGAVLDHCRKPVEHARGCWVVDGVLGRA